jgi:hypothetical protein
VGVMLLDGLSDLNTVLAREIIYGGFCWKIASRYSQIADDDTFMTSSIVAVRKTNILADFDPLLAMKVKQFTDDTSFCEKLWSKFGMIFG